MDCYLPVSPLPAAVSAVSASASLCTLLAAAAAFTCRTGATFSTGSSAAASCRVCIGITCRFLVLPVIIKVYLCTVPAVSAIAAVSAAVGLTECTINEVMGIGAQVKAREKDARISLKLPPALNDAGDDLCQTVMTGMLVYLQAMAEEYPDNLTVLLDDDDDKG